MKRSVAILTGGESSEREIAIRSAQVVGDLIRPMHKVIIYDFPSDRERFLSEYNAVDAVIPVFHGKGGEDGAIQGFLKTLSIPFLFSDVAAHAIGLNKAHTKRIVSQDGVLTPSFCVRKRGEAMEYTSPCVIKPVDGGSSIGVSLATSLSEFLLGTTNAFHVSNEVMIETYISGAEYTVAVIDEGGTVTALPVIQVRSKNAFFDFESKYDADLVEEICPAQIATSLSEELKKIATRVHQLIGVRHMSRSDFIVDSEGRIWFLEVNTIPGQTLQSLVPKAIRASGRDFAELLNVWIEEVIQEKRRDTKSDTGA